MCDFRRLEMQPQHVVVLSPQEWLRPQLVERLQHCSYSHVNDPRKFFWTRSQQGHHRFRTAQPHDSHGPPATNDHGHRVRLYPCELEVDNYVNFRNIVGKALWAKGFTAVDDMWVQGL